MHNVFCQNVGTKSAATTVSAKLASSLMPTAGPVILASVCSTTVTITVLMGIELRRMQQWRPYCSAIQCAPYSVPYSVVENACVFEQRIINGIKYYSKGCNQPNACLSNQFQNSALLIPATGLLQCNSGVDNDSTCYFCCFNQMCNSQFGVFNDYFGYYQNGCDGITSPYQHVEIEIFGPVTSDQVSQALIITW